MASANETSGPASSGIEGDVQPLQPRSRDFLIAAGGLLAVGLSLALFHKPIGFYFYLAWLYFEINFEITDNVEPVEYYEAVAHLSGLFLTLAGTFLLGFGKRHGLLMRAKPLLNRLCAFLPPAKLIGAAFLFCLPWVEIHCQQKDGDGPWGPIVVTQTGLQAALGTCDDDNLRNPFREAEREMSGYPKEPVFKYPPEPIPLLALFCVLIVWGIGAGLVLRPGSTRTLVLLPVTAAAFMVLMVQMQSDFPIADSIAAENLAMQRDPRKWWWPGSPYEGPPVFVLRYTCWYYGTAVLSACAVLAVVADWLMNRKGAGQTQG
jgi:hypothetical protein